MSFHLSAEAKLVYVFEIGRIGNYKGKDKYSYLLWRRIKGARVVLLPAQLPVREREQMESTMLAMMAGAPKASPEAQAKVK